MNNKKWSGRSGDPTRTNDRGFYLQSSFAKSIQGLQNVGCVFVEQNAGGGGAFVKWQKLLVSSG